MILAVCADKHAPGVTTAATALSLLWPGECVLLEADPSGGDLLLRLQSPHRQPLAIDTGVTSLAADAREGIEPEALTRHAQPTSLGFRVLPAPLSAEGFEPIGRLWPQIAVAAQAWRGTVIADLGRLQLRHAASPLAAAATVVLLLTRAQTSEDLEHVRRRAHELAGRLEPGPQGHSPLVVAVVAPTRSARAAVEQVRRVLTANASTSTIPVAGWLAEDARAVEGLRTGVLTKRLLGSDLAASARSMVDALTGWFPDLIESVPSADPASAPPRTPTRSARRRHEPAAAGRTNTEAL